MIDTNGTKNGVNGVNCGANDGTNGAEVPLNKEQVQMNYPSHAVQWLLWTWYSAYEDRRK